MKKLYFSFIAFLFIQVTILGQQGWFLQCTTSESLHSVYFISSTTGWTVGFSGTILKTINEGYEWTSQTSGTTEWLQSVHFVDINTGWVVGTTGLILKTTDGGTNWNPQLSGTTEFLYSVYFVDINTGWVVGGGGTILKTTNGGTSWNPQSSGTTEPLTSVHFVNINTGWAVGYFNTILKTTDGGTNWNPQPGGSGNAFNSVYFEDNFTGFVVTNSGKILKTIDGGTNWSSQYVGNWNLSSVHFIDLNTGWVVGNFPLMGGGVIYNTIDGGENWTPQSCNPLPSLSSVYFVDQNYGWAVGWDWGGIIIHTTNGGIPVELTSFTATFINGEVILDWMTATEANNLGFEIERRIINNQQQSEWERIGFREGHGTTTEPKEYSYTDNISGIAATSLAYRLKQIDYNGTYEYSDEVFVNNIAPVQFVLEQNYPNPFNPSTTISYGVPVKSHITLKVFNSLGKEVVRLVNEEQAPGTYQLVFSAKGGSASGGNAYNLPSGIYFYRLQADNFAETKKLILLK